MTNNIQCSIESSTTKIELNSAVEGVFLVPELEGLAGLPEIRTTSGVNAGYDGGWTSAQNYDARLITIRGVIANPDVAQVEAKRRAIASLLGQGRKEQLTLHLTTEAGNSYAISVRTISCEMALQRVLTTQEFLIQLRADDPLIYDDGASAGTEAILHVQRALGGFEIDFELPLAIGGGAESTIVQNGEEMVYPIIKLYGPLHSPTVVNTTTNQQMQLNADLQYTVNWSGYENEEGSAIAISDGIENAPMTLTQLSGNATQTTYSGKNLLNPADVISGYYNPNTAEITLDDKYRTAVIDNLPAGTYTFSCDLQNCYMLRWWGDNENKPVSGSRNYQTFTTTTSGKVMICFRNTTTTSITQTVKCQIESGSPVTAYEPYVGGTASPNPDYPQAIEVVTGGQTVSVVGKNLLNAQQVVADSNNAETYITSDGDWVRFKTGGIQMIIKNSTHAQGSLTLTAIIKSGVATSNSFGLSANYTDGTQEVLSALTTTDTDEHTFTWTSNSSKTLDYLNTRNTWGKEMFLKIAGSQLELGSTATTYEPYQGQEFEINLGKNLLQPMTGLTNSGLTGVVNADGSVTATGTATTTYSFITDNSSQVLPAGTYVYSDGLDSSSAYRGMLQLRLADNTTQTVDLRNQGAGRSFTLTQPTSKVQVYVSGLTANTSYDFTIYPMIEKGTTPSSYAPYFTPIELAKINTYQDRIYPSDGKWYIEKQVGKVVLDGTENITDYNTKNNVYGARVTLPSAVVHNTQALCDYFHYVSFADFYDGTGTTRTYGTISVHDTQNITTLYMAAPNSSVTTSAQLQAWLASHPTTVYYALATPTTTETTDETLLAQLNTISELYVGVNNISIVPSAGAQGTMEIQYATEYTIDQDVAVIDSQARTITINGQDAYHLKTNESEFLLLAPGENKLYLTSATDTDEGYAEVKFKQGYLSI